MKYHVSHSRVSLGDVGIRTQQDGALMAVANKEEITARTVNKQIYGLGKSF